VSSVTEPKTRKMLEAQPWIDIRQLKVDDELLIDADPFIYQLRIINPIIGLIEVTSSDPRLKEPVVGIYLGGYYDLDDVIEFEYRISVALKMKIKFLDCIYVTNPMLTARLIGKGFYYDVF